MITYDIDNCHIMTIINIICKSSKIDILIVIHQLCLMYIVTGLIAIHVQCNLTQFIELDMNEEGLVNTCTIKK